MSVRVEGGFSQKERKPLVTLGIDPDGDGGAQAEAIMSPRAAIQVAFWLITAAGSGINDAAVVLAAGGESLTTDEVEAVLMELTKARRAIDDEEGRDDPVV